MDKTGFDFKEYMGIFQRILKPSGWFFTFGNIEMFILLNKYWKRRFEYIWVKTNAPFAVGRMPVRKHEMLFASCQLDAKISNLYFNKYAIRTKGTPYYRKRGTKANSEFLKSRFGEKIHIES